MSEPFTVNATNWHEKAEELHRACSERLSVQYNSSSSFRRHRRYQWDEGLQRWAWVLGEVGAAYEPLEAGANLQTWVFWAQLQAVPKYSRPWPGASSHPAWLNPAGGVVFSSDWGAPWGRGFFQWCGGGLYRSATDYGFRRCVELDEAGAPVFIEHQASATSYGQMQAGDIIGPWIIEDLLSYYVKCVAQNCERNEASSGLLWGVNIAPREAPIDYEADVAALIDASVSAAPPLSSPRCSWGLTLYEDDSVSPKLYNASFSAGQVSVSYNPDPTAGTPFVSGTGGGGSSVAGDLPAWPETNAQLLVHPNYERLDGAGFVRTTCSDEGPLVSSYVEPHVFFDFTNG